MDKNKVEAISTPKLLKKKSFPWTAQDAFDMLKFAIN